MSHRFDSKEMFYR